MAISGETIGMLFGSAVMAGGAMTLGAKVHEKVRPPEERGWLRAGAVGLVGGIGVASAMAGMTIAFTAGTAPGREIERLALTNGAVAGGIFGGLLLAGATINAIRSHD